MCCPPRGIEDGVGGRMLRLAQVVEEVVEQHIAIGSLIDCCFHGCSFQVN